MNKDHIDGTNTNTHAGWGISLYTVILNTSVFTMKYWCRGLLYQDLCMDGSLSSLKYV